MDSWRQEADQSGGRSGTGLDTFVILMVEMVSLIETFFKTDQTVHFKYR